MKKILAYLGVAIMVGAALASAIIGEPTPVFWAGPALLLVSIFIP